MRLQHGSWLEDWQGGASVRVCRELDLNQCSLSGLGADAANLWFMSPAEFYHEDMDNQPRLDIIAGNLCIVTDTQIIRFE